MPTLDWLLAAPMWVKASLECFWWLSIYLLIRLAVREVTGDDFWTFDPVDALSLAAVSFLIGWRRRGSF